MKKYLIFLFIFLFSCYSPEIPNEVLREIEMEDDNLCNLEGLNYYSKYYKFAERSRDVYWRCRLRIINQRITGEFDTYGYSQLYKNEFKKIRKIIINKLKDEQEKLINNIFNTLEEREHNYCLVLKDQTQLDENNPYTYKDCIQDLKELRKERYGYDNTKNNDQILDEILGEDNEINKDYRIKKVDRECVKYATNEKKLNLCQDIVKKIRSCEEDVFNKIKERRIDDKIFCSKESVKKYPNSLSIYESNDATNLSGPKINKNELVDLRNKFYEECYDKRVLKIDDYKTYIENQCKIKNLEVIDKIE